MALTKRMTVSFDLTVKIGSVAEERLITTLLDKAHDALFHNKVSHKDAYILRKSLEAGIDGVIEAILTVGIRGMVKDEFGSLVECDGDLTYKGSPARIRFNK